MSREQGLGRRKDDVRGDDLTTPAAPDTSQAPQHGFPDSHPYTCVGRWAGLVGWLTGRLMVAGLSPINSRNLIIVGRCSPSLQPKRQATWWRLQRSQPRSSLSVTRMKRIESGMWNLKASPDGLAARIGRFGGTDLTVSAGQRRCANPAAYPNCRSRRRSCRGPLVAM
jgi:hypothetical protein